jgi:predicted esterase
MMSVGDPVVHTVGARTLGRYLVASPTGAGPAPLLVGFHGYGENAERHLRALRAVPGVEHWQIASIQALHRFYQTKTGDVVGSWMTNQDREHAINDNVAYVRNVVAELRSTVAPDQNADTDTPLVYAGFSQGVAMAYRAALHAGHRCDGLIVLAGDIPPELQDEPADRWPPILLGVGRNDQWYTEAKLRADQAFLESGPISFDTVVFDGGHEWHDDFYQAAGRFLARIRTRERERHEVPQPSTS